MRREGGDGGGAEEGVLGDGGEGVEAWEDADFSAAGG